jgi:FkbM family methyltransferase
MVKPNNRRTGSVLFRTSNAAIRATYNFRKGVGEGENGPSRRCIGLSPRGISINRMKDMTLVNPPETSGRANIAGLTVSYLDRDSLKYLFTEIFVKDTYWFHTDAAEPLIVDCGSNIGMSVLYFKMIYPHARVIAVEPSPEAFALLDENVRQNDLNDVTLRQCAVWDADGAIDFYYDPDRPGSLLMSTISERMPKASRQVTAVSLSRLIEGPVDFLKMDIEGAELRVLRDLEMHDKLRFIRAMVIEYHHHIEPTADRLSELLHLLERSGFGYQLACDTMHFFKLGHFQDVLIRAYRKEGAATA